MATAIKWHLELSMEYSDEKELEDALNKVISDVKSYRRYNRSMTGSSICEWSRQKVSKMDYEERVINGNTCMVFQSKMNK